MQFKVDSYLTEQFRNLLPDLQEELDRRQEEWRPHVYWDADQQHAIVEVDDGTLSEGTMDPDLLDAIFEAVAAVIPDEMGFQVQRTDTDRDG
jgi:hypothetical protein